MRIRIRAKATVGAPLVAAPSLSIALHAPHALADSKAEAKRHFNQAVELLQDGQVREAIIEFQRAYDIKHHYLPLYNIGEAYIQLDQPVEAVEFLERCLQEGGNDIPKRKRQEIQRDIDRYKPRIAVVDVRVTPAGASVRVDDKELGVSPVADAVKVAIGRHRISALLDGYRPGSAEVIVAGEEHKTVVLTLERIPAQPALQPVGETPKGQVILECPVPEVRVAVDGQVAGQTPALTALVAETGRRVIAFARAGYVTSERAVDVNAGVTARASCGLKPQSLLPAEMAARLVVSPTEEDAEVRVDGVPFGLDAALPAGMHHVEVRKTGFVTWVGDIRVEARQTGKVEAVLVPTPAYRDRYESKASTQRWIGYGLAAGGLALGAAAYGVYRWNDGRYQDWATERDELDVLWSQRPPYPPEVQQRQDANDDLMKSVQRSDKVIVGLGIAGGALLVGGVVVLLTGDSPSRDENVAVVPKRGAE